MGEFSLKKKVNKILDFLLDLLYPNVCGFCGKINQNSLCEKCEEEINKKLIYKIEEKKDMFFEEHIYLANYEGKFREDILSYKFFDKSYMYKTFAKLALKNEKICEVIKTYNTIIPVPISKKRLAKRGYNQSSLIAKEIAKNLKLNYNDNCLIKTKDIIEQNKLNKEERLKNIVGAYKLLNEEKLYNKKLLLIDDIYTTGSTVNECSKTLAKAKPLKIGVLTIAKD